jgi:predicted ATPase/class 3 adenylate cyclase
MSLPSGTVTFLFTDIEGSTRLAQQYPDTMPILLARHHEILHQAIQAQNGYVFQIVGDSFAVAFHSASDAVNAALDAQRSLNIESWTPAPIKVRMGIHTGTSHLNDPSAPTVYSGYATIAATQRIMSAGHGGQILLSGATRELIRDSLPANTELVDLGEKRLKDLMRAEHLYQVQAAELPATFPPLKTLDAYSNNLPVQLTSFIGRENEIAEVKQELESHRLVTLTGSGGTGKTRLSLQVAAEMLEKFDHGVWFVELAPLTDTDLIPQTILSTIGVQEQQGKTPLGVLKEYLHEKQALILLDNCEHLISASAQVANMLLNAAPKLKILASSREALGVKGEASYPVPSLSLPDIKHLPILEQLSQYEAVRLFIDRASLVSPHFDVNKDNAPSIAQICFRLDGIPLAIELAAARVKMMSVEQISARLDDRFRLLTGGARTALPRQQTLRALIDWSYDLLSENERLLQRRLSVFAGGWTLEAAEEVCAGDGIDSYDVLDLLTQLVNKSLVVVIEHSQSGETRYRMLETIRQYAREKLLELGEGEKIRDRHFEYYLQTVKQANQEFFSQNELVWLVWFENEWDNLRAAVEWSLETQADLGLELVNYLGYILVDALYNVTDMDNWLSQFIRHPLNSTRTAQRAQGLLNCSVYAKYTRADQENMVPVQSMLEESFSIYEELGNQHGLAHCFFLQAYYSEDKTRFARYQRALQLFRETNDKPLIALALLNMGWWMEWLESGSRISYLEESLSLYRELGYISGTIEALKQIGSIEVQLGHFDSAHRRLDEGFSILQAHAANLGNSKILSYDLGDLAYFEGDYELAQKYYEHCLAWATQKGLSISISWAKIRLGYVFSRRGEQQKAYLFLREALFSFQKAEFTMAIISTLEGIASLLVTQNQYEKAVQLFAWADAMRDQLGDQRTYVEQASVERDLAVIRSKVNNDEYAKLSTEGSSMTIEQAIALALEEDNAPQ